MPQPEISIAPETVFQLGPLAVTNSLLGTWLAMLVLIVLVVVVRRRMSLLPGTIQGLIEWPLEGLLAMVLDGDRRHGMRYFPLVMALFVFIVTMNWMSLLPGFGTIGWVEQKNGQQVLIPFLRAGTADLNTTVALAITSFVVFMGFGVAVHGAVRYARSYTESGVFLAPLELLQHLVRPLSLSLRLFGNIFAGEAIQLVVLSLGPLAFVIPAVFILLEILFGLVQAGIFALLTMTYILLATAGHGPESEGIGQAVQQVEKNRS